MFRWINWVSWGLRLLATAVLLSFLCIWTTGYIVNSYMESIIKQLELPIDTKPFALSGIWGTLWGVDNPAKEASGDEQATSTGAKSHNAGSDGQEEPGERAAATSEDPHASEDHDSASPSKTTTTTEDHGTSPSPSPSTSPENEQASIGEVVQDDAIPAISGQTGADDAKMTDAERQALYANVVSKLDESQLQLLSEALEGGLSAEKLAQVKEMLKTALTDDEYAQMMDTLQGTAKAD